MVGRRVGAVVALVAAVVVGCDSGGSTGAAAAAERAVFAVRGNPAPDGSLDRTARILQRRYRTLGVRDARVRVRGVRIVAQGPAAVAKLAPRVSARGRLEFRPVLATAFQPPDPGGSNPPVAWPTQVPGQAVLRAAGTVPITYQVGPPAIRRGVAAASARHVQGEGWVVDLRLTPTAIRRLDALAAALYPNPPPQNSVAIVLDAVVTSAPVFVTGHFHGDQVDIAGDLDHAQVDILAAILDAGPFPVGLRRVR